MKSKQPLVLKLKMRNVRLEDHKAFARALDLLYGAGFDIKNMGKIQDKKGGTWTDFDLVVP